MSIGFNPSFLTDVVRVIDSNELRIEMSASNKPAVLKSGDDFLYVLMPIDIS
jgi:DNA polymerase-3 subunit beta